MTVLLGPPPELMIDDEEPARPRRAGRGRAGAPAAAGAPSERSGGGVGMSG
ncbi:hypothetical protein [Nocardioides convexus]|uniref:hypothetical protein n=1 Tax=Nocardioides convexus TaxID=2712224 RepID=UPI00310173AA